VEFGQFSSLTFIDHEQRIELRIRQYYPSSKIYKNILYVPIVYVYDAICCFLQIVDLLQFALVGYEDFVLVDDLYQPWLYKN
jgi:hypothetical protein